VDCSFNNTMIKVVKKFSSFFGSIWFTRPLTIHNTVHWSVRHTQSFRCLLIYPYRFLNSKINEFYLELEVLTKYVTVMLLIVLAEAALRWNFIYWSYFVVIFRVGVDVLYRRTFRTSCILPVKSFSQPRVL
jgi:competence CoiA-like predicted nuclease